MIGIGLFGTCEFLARRGEFYGRSLGRAGLFRTLHRYFCNRDGFVRDGAGGACGNRRGYGGERDRRFAHLRVSRIHI